MNNNSNNRPAKISHEIIGRYRFIRAAHTILYNQLKSDIVVFSPEFFYFVGDVMEGKPLIPTSLRHIDLNRVREFLKEDR